jgi:hypothetical protein
MAFLMQKKESVDAMIAAGLMPRECVSWELRMAVDEPVTIRSKCFATEEQVLMMVAALAEDPERAKAIAREIIFRAPSGVEVEVRL